MDNLQIIRTWDYWTFRGDFHDYTIRHYTCTEFKAPNGDTEIIVCTAPKLPSGNRLRSGNYDKAPGDFGYKTKAEAIQALEEHIKYMEDYFNRQLEELRKFLTADVDKKIADRKDINSCYLNEMRTALKAVSET